MSNIERKIPATVKNFPMATSASDQWIAWYDAVKKTYGKQPAATIFAEAWRTRGGIATKASVVDIREATGLPLDNATFLDSLRSVGSGSVGIFSEIGTVTKVVVYSLGGLTIVLLGGLVFRIITASANEVGTVTGVAARAFVTKGK